MSFDKHQPATLPVSAGKVSLSNAQSHATLVCANLGIKRCAGLCRQALPAHARQKTLAHRCA